MLGQPALLEHFASRRLQVLAVRTVCDLVLGKMDKTCEMKRTTLDSPLGKLELSGCEQGLHKISFLGQGTPAAERLRSVAGQPCPPARAKSPRCLVNMQFSQHLPRRSNSAMEVPAPAEVLRGPEPLKQCAAWLNAYFQQPEAIEELPVPALHHPVFQQESFTRQVLWELLKAVKFGEVVSYQQLAALAGNPKAARAVGGAMRSNPQPSSGATQDAKEGIGDMAFLSSTSALPWSRQPRTCGAGRQRLDPEGPQWRPSGHVEVLHLPGENTQLMGEGESVFQVQFCRFCLVVAAIVSTLVSVEKVAEGFQKHSVFGGGFGDHQPASLTVASESSSGQALL
uniref:Methylated-DNA--protein-cysteine methyltransferase n=1 Tax=Callithrix jacchus TaxID=9483 RepID=A0A8I3W3L0_CALJA